MNHDMSYGNDYHFIPATSMQSGKGIEVSPDLYQHTIQIVNVIFYGKPNLEDFVLIDAGMPNSANEIISLSKKRFGMNSRPKAIILTHGHFDHVGAIIDLVQYWNVPVYAHSLEMPFLTGQKSYERPDTTVEGGLVAKMSSIFPIEPINLGDHLYTLPDDGSVPHMPGFQWIHTPGHTPGHVSLFRDADRTLIVGDAFVTVKQDSLYKVLTQKLEVCGPPRYLTTDWQKAWDSVKHLESLLPSRAVTGHGMPISGEELTINLKHLAENFQSIAVPDYGLYIKD